MRPLRIIDSPAECSRLVRAIGRLQRESAERRALAAAQAAHTQPGLAPNAAAWMAVVGWSIAVIEMLLLWGLK